MLTLLLAACTPSEVQVGPDEKADDSAPVDPPDPDDTDTIEVIDDTAVDTDPDTTDTDTPPDDTGDDDDTLPKACADLYDPDTLQTFELTVAADAWDGFRRDCQNGEQTYRPVTFTWNGESVDAMARLKGNWSWSCDKLQFVISFNSVDPDARFHGLRKTILDAPWYDRTLLHERVAFPIFEARGLPYSCVNNARLYVNGEYYGAYSNVERLDREYLERHFADPSGNLYQGGSELETNEDDGDTTRLTALQNARTVEEIAELVDLDQAVSEWAVEAMLPAMDNYWAGVEINYYLYDDPTRGFVFLPYDLDISFGDAAYTSGEKVWPNAVSSDPITYEHPGWQKEALVQTVLSDAAWCERFVEELVLARAAYDPSAMSAQVEAWSAQIADAVAEDPHKHWSTADHAAAVAELRAFFAERAAYVDGWLAEGGHCPGRF